VTVPQVVAWLFPPLALAAGVWLLLRSRAGSAMRPFGGATGSQPVRPAADRVGGEDMVQAVAALQRVLAYLAGRGRLRQADADAALVLQASVMEASVAPAIPAPPASNGGAA
jgi:hypothetical protein